MKKRNFVLLLATAIVGVTTAVAAVCSRCDGSGTGSFACTFCDGSGLNGSMKCTFCNGRGIQKCPNCSGTGQR